MSKSSEETILDYMKKQNRPYSANDIFNNLHKEIGKSAVVKVLEGLSLSGEVLEKTYGKQKVYVYDQTKLPVTDDSELKILSDETLRLQVLGKDLSHRCRQLEEDLRSLNNSATTDDAIEKVALQNEEIVSLEKKLEVLENGERVDPDMLKLVSDRKQKALKQWRTRKRIVMDILGTIMEGYPKSKENLFEEIGIETDEEVGVKIPVG